MNDIQNFALTKNIQAEERFFAKRKP